MAHRVATGNRRGITDNCLANRGCTPGNADKTLRSMDSREFNHQSSTRRGHPQIARISQKCHGESPGRGAAGRPKKPGGVLWVPCLRARKHVGPSDGTWLRQRGHGRGSQTRSCARLTYHFCVCPLPSRQLDPTIRLSIVLCVMEKKSWCMPCGRQSVVSRDGTCWSRRCT
jgi:hypothetical protein